MPTATLSTARMLEGLVSRRPPASAPASRSVTVGLVGRGIQSSRTPIMHEREGARLGLQYHYVLIDFDELGLPDTALGDVVEAAQELGFAGLNVTHPFKQLVIPHLSALADDAEVIGAVNTVVFANGRRTGHNTDCDGFAQSFRDEMAGCPLAKVVQLGAGGAGMAVAHALLTLGVGELSVFDIDSVRAEQLARAMRARWGRKVESVRSPDEAIGLAGGLVNTTPIGMAKYPGMPIRADLLSPQHWVAEIIYFPPETELVRHAQALGCRTLKGAGMAVNQAVLAFELFAGVAADRTAMTAHFQAAA